MTAVVIGRTKDGRVVCETVTTNAIPTHAIVAGRTYTLQTKPVLGKNGYCFAFMKNSTGWDYVFEWKPDENRLIDWNRPHFICRSYSRSEDTAKRMPDGKPVAAPESEAAVDLLGDKMSPPATPHRQLVLFDKAEYVRIHRGIPAVVCRENGERASGAISSAVAKKGRFTFAEQETGKSYSIPARCCTVTWAGDVAVIAIPEDELFRHVSLYGIFASCCLF